MTSKHKGLCPFCKAEVIPRVIQKTMYDEISANALSAKKQFTYVALRGVRITLRVVVCMTMSCVRHVHQVLAAESAH